MFKLVLEKAEAPEIKLTTSVVSLEKAREFQKNIYFCPSPCPSPTPRVYSNSHPWCQWCHSIISSSVVPFSSCLQCFPASGSFPMSRFFTSGGQSIGVSALASAFPINILISFRIDWLGIFGVQRTLKSLLQHHSSEESILQCSAFFIVQLSHPYMTTGKIIALTRRIFVGNVLAF